jgi:hypothetical protein
VRSALISLAGPVADLAFAALALTLPIPRWVAVLIAAVVGASGLANLVPGKTERGMLSDGATLVRELASSRAARQICELLAAPDWSSQPDALRRLIDGWVLDVPAAEKYLKQLPGDRPELLRLYAQTVPLPEWPELEFLNILNALSWKVVAKPDLPAGLVYLAGIRVEWVLEHADKGKSELRPGPATSGTRSRSSGSGRAARTTPGGSEPKRWTRPPLT